jgi:membrane protease subunit HflK
LVEPARGEADRFTRVLAEARHAPTAFRHRLFLETVAELLPRFRRTVVVTPGQDLDISLFGDEPPPRGRESPE